MSHLWDSKFFLSIELFGCEAKDLLRVVSMFLWHLPNINISSIFILQKLREEVANAQHLQEMYREQLVTLEDDLARLREQDDLKNDDFNVSVVYFLAIANLSL